MAVAIASTLTFRAQASLASDCEQLIGTCSYYKCLSADVSCTANDYPLDFGYRYCTDFDQKALLFTAKGRAFLTQVKTCLQRKIEARPLSACGDVEAGAPTDHFECYAEAHFCSLPFHDQGLIGETVFVTMVSKPGFRRAAEKISESCGYLP